MKKINNSTLRLVIPGIVFILGIILIINSTVFGEERAYQYIYYGSNAENITNSMHQLYIGAYISKYMLLGFLFSLLGGYSFLKVYLKEK